MTRLIATLIVTCMLGGCGKSVSDAYKDSENAQRDAAEAWRIAISAYKASEAKFRSEADSASLIPTAEEERSDPTLKALRDAQRDYQESAKRVDDARKEIEAELRAINSADRQISLEDQELAKRGSRSGVDLAELNEIRGAMNALHVKKEELKELRRKLAARERALDETLRAENDRLNSAYYAHTSRLKSRTGATEKRLFADSASDMKKSASHASSLYLAAAAAAAAAATDANKRHLADSAAYEAAAHVVAFIDKHGDAVDPAAREASRRAQQAAEAARLARN